jgi:hypothetical protein
MRAWVNPDAVSAERAKDVQARAELAERNGSFDERTAASRIAAGKGGRTIALMGKKKMARARVSEPVA